MTRVTLFVISGVVLATTLLAGSVSAQAGTGSTGRATGGSTGVHRSMGGTPTTTMAAQRSHRRRGHHMRGTRRHRRYSAAMRSHHHRRSRMSSTHRHRRYRTAMRSHYRRGSHMRVVTRRS